MKPKDKAERLASYSRKSPKAKFENPVQPIYIDEQGTLRCKVNKIVRFLLDNGPFDMNKLACMNFSIDDREQFAQLIGYSVSGLGELPYVHDSTYDRVEKQPTHHPRKWTRK